MMVTLMGLVKILKLEGCLKGTYLKIHITDGDDEVELRISQVD